jgi:hypothetical protein
MVFDLGLAQQRPEFADSTLPCPAGLAKGSLHLFRWGAEQVCLQCIQQRGQCGRSIPTRGHGQAHANPWRNRARRMRRRAVSYSTASKP